MYNLIPELKEAEDRYVQEQVEAFLMVEPDVNGVDLLPFTTAMFIELDEAGCQIFRRVEKPERAHVAMFLWRCSKQFSRGKWYSDWLRKRFIRTVSKRCDEKTVEDIRAYLKRSYAPMPLPRRKAGDQSFAAYPSRIVHFFARTYGWSEEYILNLPVRRLYQYLNRIMEDSDPKYQQLCPEAAKLQADWLKKVNGITDTKD